MKLSARDWKKMSSSEIYSVDQAKELLNSDRLLSDDEVNGVVTALVGSDDTDDWVLLSRNGELFYSHDEDRFILSAENIRSLLIGGAKHGEEVAIKTGLSSETIASSLLSGESIAILENAGILNGLIDELADIGSEPAKLTIRLAFERSDVRPWVGYISDFGPVVEGSLDPLKAYVMYGSPDRLVALVWGEEYELNPKFMDPVFVGENPLEELLAHIQGDSAMPANGVHLNGHAHREIQRLIDQAML